MCMTHDTETQTPGSPDLASPVMAKSTAETGEASPVSKSLSNSEPAVDKVTSETDDTSPVSESSANLETAVDKVTAETNGTTASTLPASTHDASPRLLSDPLDPDKPLTLREMQEAISALRQQMAREKKRVKEERVNRKEHVRVLCILGEMIAHHGPKRIEQALDRASWLEPEKRLIVEYYFELRPRPTAAKQKTVTEPAA